MFYVTHQSYVYDNGAQAIEVMEAPSFDHVSPGMIRSIGEGEYTDPREAAEAAITFAAERGLPIVRAYGSGGMIYPTIEDAEEPGALREWAEKCYTEAPKCERCGDVVANVDNYTTLDGDRFTACSEFCAEEYAAADAFGGVE